MAQSPLSKNHAAPPSAACAKPVGRVQRGEAAKAPLAAGRSCSPTARAPPIMLPAVCCTRHTAAFENLLRLRVQHTESLDQARRGDAAEATLAAADAVPPQHDHHLAHIERHTAREHTAAPSTCYSIKCGTLTP